MNVRTEPRHPNELTNIEKIKRDPPKVRRLINNSRAQLE